MRVREEEYVSRNVVANAITAAKASVEKAICELMAISLKASHANRVLLAEDVERKVYELQKIQKSLQWFEIYSSHPLITEFVGRCRVRRKRTTRPEGRCR